MGGGLEINSSKIIMFTLTNISFRSCAGLTQEATASQKKMKSFEFKMKMNNLPNNNEKT